MGKWTDKLYITQSEWAMEHGPKSKTRENDVLPLPFNYCALSLRPIGTNRPYYDPLSDSIIDYKVLQDYIQRQLSMQEESNSSFDIPHPILPSKNLDLNQLIRLRFYENQGKFLCPITKHEFSQYSPVVALKCSGNVYHLEALQKLAFETKNYVDLLDNSLPFKKKPIREGGDLIWLQDPTNPKLRKFEKGPQSTVQSSIQGPMVKKVIRELDLRKEKVLDIVRSLGNDQRTFLTQEETSLLSTLEPSIGYVSMNFKLGPSLTFQLVPDNRNSPFLFKFMTLLGSKIYDFQYTRGVLAFKVESSSLLLPFLSSSEQKQPMAPFGFYWKIGSKQILISSVSPKDQYISWLYLGQVYYLKEFLDYYGFALAELESVDLEDTWKSMSKSWDKLILFENLKVIDQPFVPKAGELKKKRALDFSGW